MTGHWRILSYAGHAAYMTDSVGEEGKDELTEGRTWGNWTVTEMYALQTKGLILSAENQTECNFKRV